MSANLTTGFNDDKNAEKLALIKDEVTPLFETKLKQETKFLKCSDSFVLLNIPAGKPNRNRKYELEPQYVRQPQQKYGTCNYHSYKISAMLDKDYLVKQKTKNRKAASEYRKALTQANYLHQMVLFFFSIINQSDVNSSTDNSTSSIKSSSLDGFRMIIKMLQDDGEKFQLFNMKEEKASKEDYTILANLLSEYIDQYEVSTEFELKMYLEQRYLCDRICACLSFLRALNLDPVGACQNYALNLNEQLLDNSYVISEHFEGMSLENKLWILSATVEHHLAAVFELVPNHHWNPLDPITVLLNAFKKNPTPFIIGGGFGKIYYSKNETEIAPIEGYLVYGYPKDSHKGKLQSTTHCIAVIGVEINQKGTVPSGWVYYVDPMDSSDPHHSDLKKRSRKIFKISYEQFCKWALDNSNRHHINQPVKPSRNLRYGYWK